MNDQAENDLIQLGLSLKEAQTYLTLLRMGPSAASTLARLTRIKRTSMYDVLNSLLERNLVSQFQQGKATYYVVDDLKRLTQDASAKLTIAKDLTRTLKEKQNLNPGIQVNYYKGIEGYREIYEDILRAHPKELIGWLNLDFFYKGLDPQREEEWTRERAAKKISARLLVQETKIGRAFQKEDGQFLRETRLIPEGKFPFQSTCLLYEDFITYYDSTDDIVGIRIHNPQLAEMQRQIFEMGWNFSA